ncbi:MAG: methyltransferase domain-containing protein [bacterium]|nr:MAG: methyltransferase domain-containing protein [bacterium]
MTSKKLQTRQCNSESDIRQFFEETAPEYREAHGDSGRLLQYRMEQLHKLGHLNTQDVVLDVGCGNGHHLYYIAPVIKYGIGVDFSRNMIESAQKARNESPHADKLQFQVDYAQELKTIEDSCVDLVMCIGAFEHMLEKTKVVRQFYRVLKPGGRIILMTPNGKYIWYRLIAPLFGYSTRHLSTDLFLPASELKALFTESGFNRIQTEYWSFIPRGDMSKYWGSFLGRLDLIGKLIGLHFLQGGIILRADKI